MLSSEYIHILQWFDSHKDQYFSEYQIRRSGVKVDYLVLNWLYEHDFLARYIEDEPYNPEVDSPPYMYRISPGGSSKLAEHKNHIFMELRAWVTLGIALAGFTMSLFNWLGK